MLNIDWQSWYKNKSLDIALLFSIIYAILVLYVQVSSFAYS